MTKKMIIYNSGLEGTAPRDSVHGVAYMVDSSPVSPGTHRPQQEVVVVSHLHLSSLTQSPFCKVRVRVRVRSGTATGGGSNKKERREGTGEES
jgi:hypothetical protein